MKLPVMKNDDWAWQMSVAGVLLIGALLYFLRFSSAYFTPERQLDLGWGCLLALILMYQSKKTRQQPWRLVFLVLSAFLALRYFIWRTTDTLLYTGPFDFVGMALVYIAELYGLAIYFMGMFVNVWPMESQPVTLSGNPERLPTVDVLIPTYNEAEEILRTTVTAATNLDYPKHKLRVYILDDGSTHAKRNHPQSGMAAWERHYRIRQMAAELGVGYLTRETNQHAKAGNINHALGYTDGDLVLVLDCDHVPTRDILQRTVGHFIADPKLFLVQTPHFFINPTPVEKNLEGVANPSGENDMFYRKIHPALNFWNASYFCGSAALLRRSCLQEVGGISGTTITEDAETAFHLHSLGYNSVYVNRPMVCGLSPESYDDYVIQRSRWAQGMVQLLMLNNPLKAKGLSLPQKVAYFNSSFFWFFGLSRFIYFIAPAMYLILGLNIYHASWLQILIYTLPYLISSHLVMDFFYAGSRQPFFSEIYESVQSLFLIPAVLSVIINPWKPSFKVTPKGLTNDKNYLSPLAAPFFAVITINLVAIALAINKWFAEPILRDVIAVTAIWSIYNLYLSLVSLGAFWERKQIRKFHRINTRGRVSAFFPRMGTTHDGKVRDVSITGIGFDIELPFLPREQEQVVLTVWDSNQVEYRFETKLQRIIPRNGSYSCGCEFVHNHVSYADVVNYVFGDSQRWQDIWDQKSSSRGTFRMLRHFLRTGIEGFIGSAYPLLKVAFSRLWRLAVRLTTTPLLWEKMLAVLSWDVYYLFLILSALIQRMDSSHARKLQRHQTSGTVTLYFPRFDSMLTGEMTDVSLTGMGILATLPFQIREGEHATIRATGKDGVEHRLPCLIQRTLRRDGQYLFGAEFIVDAASYEGVVKFVYGDSKQMLRYAVIQGQALAGQIGTVVASFGGDAMRSIGQLFAFIFLNQEHSPGEQLATLSQLARGNRLMRQVLRKLEALRIALALVFVKQDVRRRERQYALLLYLMTGRSTGLAYRAWGRKLGRLGLTRGLLALAHASRRHAIAPSAQESSAHMPY